MTLHMKSAFCALALASLIVLSGQAQAAPQPDKQSSEETTLDVKAKLDSFAEDYVLRINTTIKPNRNHVSVKKTGRQYIASFREVDLDTMVTEIYPSKAPGCSYVGHIIYLEKEYESIGKTRNAAQKGEFKQMRARRIRELFRYNNGKWCF